MEKYYIQFHEDIRKNSDVRPKAPLIYGIRSKDYICGFLSKNKVDYVFYGKNKLKITSIDRITKTLTFEEKYLIGMWSETEIIFIGEPTNG